MQVANKKSGKNSRNGSVVVAGSVWENRMRFDEFKGGINVYSEKEKNPQVENDEKISVIANNHHVQVDKKLDMGSKSSNLDVVDVVVGSGFFMSGNRKTWKCESNFEGNSVELSRKRSEEQLCKELSTVGAMKKSSSHSKKNDVSPNGSFRSCKKNVAVDESKRKNLERVFSESSDRNERKVKSGKAENENVVDESKEKSFEGVFGGSNDGIQLRKGKSGANKKVKSGANKVENENVAVYDESKEENLERVFDESSDGDEGNRIKVRKVKSGANKVENENVVDDVVEESEEKNLERVFGESSDGNEGNRIQLKSEKCEEVDENFKKSDDVIEENEVVVDDVLDDSKKNLERVFGELSDGNEGNRVQLRKVKSGANKVENEDVVDVLDESKKNLEGVFSESSDGNEGNQIQLRKVKPEASKAENENGTDGNEGDRTQLRKVKSEANKAANEGNRIQLRKVKSEANKAENEDGSDGNERNRIQLKKVKSGENQAENEDESDGNDGNGIHLRKVKSGANKLEKEDGTDGNEGDRVHLRKVKSGANKAENEDDGNEGDRVHLRKVKSGVNKLENEDDGKEGNRVHLRKVKSGANKAENEDDGNEGNRVHLRKVKSGANKAENEDDGNEGNRVHLRKVKSGANKLENEDDGKEGNRVQPRKVKSGAIKAANEDGNVLVKTKSEKCTKSFEKNKVVSDESKSNNVEHQQKINLENEEFKILEEDIEKEINLTEEIKTKKIVIVEENKVHVGNNEKKTVSISPIIKKKSHPISGQSRIHQHYTSPSTTKPVPTSDEFQRNIPRQHSKLESFVDLIMWTDASKSALIFGIGTFFIISSSYTQDLNISFISVISYLGLVYLATIFLFRSLRGANDIGESSEYILGDEEAMWVLKLILPYINEFLMKIRALFSGDPATTMKMAVLLFILARCGSSITIWKMSKLGFFAVFIIPKACSSYSTQLTAYGTFWIRRFRDAWVSCTHKKAVGFAIFTLIWNLSSISARIWAVFMLYVGFKYYQQKMMKEGWIGEEERRIGRKSTLMESKKQRKTF
ncbi:uncharacterized protein DDB_G0290685-like [Capsicum annuum]|uniref:uncharacterized protein DDB_G0290685-like n=1 Tax=Capsicum annuum TaxID=4072 RepID=UPI001FB16458|nr:uncharacterized protein DDB_G0290685-like [Capsicum annuum]